LHQNENLRLQVTRPDIANREETGPFSFTNFI